MGISYCGGLDRCFRAGRGAPPGTPAAQPYRLVPDVQCMMCIIPIMLNDCCSAFPCWFSGLRCTVQVMGELLGRIGGRCVVQGDRFTD